eukprot:873389-Prymnesium_polylepis.1
MGRDALRLQASSQHALPAHMRGVCCPSAQHQEFPACSSISEACTSALYTWADLSSSELRAKASRGTGRLRSAQHVPRRAADP